MEVAKGGLRNICFWNFGVGKLGQPEGTPSTFSFCYETRGNHEKSQNSSRDCKISWLWRRGTWWCFLGPIYAQIVKLQSAIEKELMEFQMLVVHHLFQCVMVFQEQMVIQVFHLEELVLELWWYAGASLAGWPYRLRWIRWRPISYQSFCCVIACIVAFNTVNSGAVYEDDGYTTVTTTTYGGLWQVSSWRNVLWLLRGWWPNLHWPLRKMEFFSFNLCQ